MRVLPKGRPKRKVVVKYKIRNLSQSRISPRVFLSSEKILTFKMQMARRLRDVNIAVISPVGQFGSSQYKVVRIIIPYYENNRLGEIDSILETQGRINVLFNRAKVSRYLRAHDEDLSVAVEDGDAVEDLVDDTQLEQQPVNGMVFYEYTEKAHAILSQVIAGYSRLELKEQKKEHPDTAFLNELQNNQAVAYNLLRKSATFSSLAQMNEVIADYTPIVRALYEDAPTSQLAAS